MFAIRFKAKDGRKGVLSIVQKGHKLTIAAEVEGSDKLKKIGLYQDITIAVAPDTDLAAFKNLFDILND